MGLMAELIHIVGHHVEVDGVRRQRCLWCGALIDERDFKRMSVQIQEGQTPEEAAQSMRDSHWVGLVAVDGNVKWSVDDPPDGKIPVNSCMNLEESVTA